MSRDWQVTIDARDPRSLGLFWREALHYAVDPPPGREIGQPAETVAAWLVFLRAQGVPDELHNSAFAIIDPSGHGPRVFLQRVPKGTPREPATLGELSQPKNTMHLDVRAAPGLSGDDRMAALEAEADRLVALGATRVQRFEPEPPMGAGHIVMEDPEGNVFCLD